MEKLKENVALSYTKELLDGFYKYFDKSKKLDNFDFHGVDKLLTTLKRITTAIEASVTVAEGDIYIHEMYGELDEENSVNKKANKEGFVYIAKQLNEDDIYKIGITNDISKRGRTFKTGNAFVEMIASIKCDKYKELEKQIHFRERKKRFTGEWFKLNNYSLNLLIKDYKFNIHME